MASRKHYEGEERAVQQWIRRNDYREKGPWYRDLMIQGVPFDGCKYSTARKLVALWNRKTQSLGQGSRIHCLDISGKCRPGDKRVTAFARLVDERLHPDIIGCMSYLPVTYKGVTEHCPINSAKSWPCESRRAEYNYERLRPFVCLCDMCSEERNAELELTREKSGPVGTNSELKFNEARKQKMRSLVVHKCENIDIVADEPTLTCPSPACSYYKERYIELVNKQLPALTLE